MLWKNTGEACQDVGELATQQGGYPCSLVNPLREPFPHGVKKQVLAAALFALRAPLAQQHGSCLAEGKGRSHRSLQVQKQQRLVTQEEETLPALVQAGTHRQQVDGKPVPDLQGSCK